MISHGARTDILESLHAPPREHFDGDRSELYALTRKHRIALSCPACAFSCAAEWTPKQWPGPGATKVEIEEYQRYASSRSAIIDGAAAMYAAHVCTVTP